MFLNTLVQKISTYPCTQFCAPHLKRQRKFYAACFSNCGNPTKPLSRINPDNVGLMQGLFLLELYCCIITFFYFLLYIDFILL